MAQPVIQVRDLGKLYRIRSTERQPYSNLREDLVNGIKRFVRGDFAQSQSEDFWALKNVSFDVHQGEVVGIIGRNGAGKSTLLKILSRIVQPTTGEAIIRGRVGSLLEVGTGFHPELTGRENIFMNGAVLGMKRAEIKKQFDAIAAFAEVDKFLDTPVKFYSSGMYVRLAFAVAAHLEPEILIVDEVLAVGDAAFQKKCLGKMGEVSEKDGRTVLFVSHNMTMIEQLCPRALLINSGNLSKDSSSYMVIGEYFNSTKHDLIMKSNSHSIVTLLSFDVCIESDEYPTNISNGDKLSIKWSFILRATESIAFCLIIKREGTLVCAINTYHQNALFQELFPDHYVCKVNIPEYTLNPGFHSFGLNISDQTGNEIWFQADNLIGLNILDDNYRRGNLFKGKWPGAVSLLPQVCIQKNTQSQIKIDS